MKKYYLVLAYDRRNEKDDSVLQKVVSALVNAEAGDMSPVLNTTIEFSLETQVEEKELFWIIDRLTTLIEPYAFVKIYLYAFSKGSAKIFNPKVETPKNDNNFIGKKFQEAKLNAEAAKMSFRNEFSNKL